MNYINYINILIIYHCKGMVIKIFDLYNIFYFMLSISPQKFQEYTRDNIWGK